MTTPKHTEGSAVARAKWALTPYLGALLEAWDELRINRNRIMLSLVSVAAAVWAMSTVLALGNIITSSLDKLGAQYSGVPGTVTLEVSRSDGSASSLDMIRPDGSIVDPFSDAALSTVKAVDANIWSRVLVRDVAVVKQERPECDWDVDPMCIPEMTPQMSGVDPGWFDIFQKSIVQGRSLEAADGARLMNPAVISETLWNELGNPPVDSHPTFSVKESPGTSFTIVGVLKSTSSWDPPEAIVSYDTLINARLGDGASRTALYVAAPADQARQAKATLRSILSAELDRGWSVQASVAEKDQEALESQNKMLTTVLGVIGGIVISLGALGLLTVSIVTIKYRVREIGIRRAMGASANRIFISVFLESVVATTVAGVVGVILSIITIKQLPLETLLQLPIGLGSVPYPLTAALVGVLIATIVGAVAGLIPATIAVRVKPIDAIRF